MNQPPPAWQTCARCTHKEQHVFVQHMTLGAPAHRVIARVPSFPDLWVVTWREDRLGLSVSSVLLLRRTDEPASWIAIVNFFWNNWWPGLRPRNKVTGCFGGHSGMLIMGMGMSPNTLCTASSRFPSPSPGNTARPGPLARGLSTRWGDEHRCGGPPLRCPPLSTSKVDRCPWGLCSK